MSFNRLAYDTCSYVTEIKESMQPGEYMINTPNASTDEGCFFPNPQIRMNKHGASLCDKNLIDVDSELLGLNVLNTKCPSEQYTPSDKPFCNLVNMKECDFLSPEDTKLSNPPCTLRGTGWNRWEWLCENPQSKGVIAPFEIGIQNRLVVKDNHRPCIPTPIDNTISLPSKLYEYDHDEEAHNSEVLQKWTTMYEHGANYPMIHWRCCGEIAKL
jgi:hypothetical protein